MATDNISLKTEPYVCEARPEEYERVLDITASAFELDPSMMYFGSVKSDQVCLRAFNSLEHVLTGH